MPGIDGMIDLQFRKRVERVWTRMEKGEGGSDDPFGIKIALEFCSAIVRLRCEKR